VLAELGHQLAQALDVATTGVGVDAGQGMEVGLRELERKLFGHDLPDALARGRVGGLVADQRDAARHDGFVDVVDAVRGQEEQAVEVLEHAQEHADHGVGGDVVAALADVDVGLVDQHDGTPALRTGECFFQGRFERADAQPQLARMHAVKRPAGDLGVDLGRQRLAHTRGAGAQHGGATALAGDHVVLQHVHLGGEDVDQFGLLGRQHQLELDVGLVGIGLHIVDVHPQVLVQLKVEDEEVGVDGQRAEQLPRQLGLKLFDLFFEVEVAALGGAAQVGAEDLARRLQ
jgi:hypothetical protein